MDEYRRGAHSVFEIYPHLAWVTRYRKPELVGPIGVRRRDIIQEPGGELGTYEISRLDDWSGPYREMLARSGELLTERLVDLPQPFCLLCAEKHVMDCHRRMIADFLTTHRGWDVEHIE